MRLDFMVFQLLSPASYAEKALNRCSTLLKPVCVGLRLNLTKCEISGQTINFVKLQVHGGVTLNTNNKIPFIFSLQSVSASFFSLTSANLHM